ncbi:uracil-DNA glycosylase family protein [uncultured Alsobacter sp.]|uniref:uracil-DNA glycosylase family protein n=1 Tax=uncultured Alsobacter sp. TaxID=1748258 RepID=UPI0025CDA6DF|nr:uracil-DNA glycosylase family protein [uncultured Alsobacter sp.]
MAAGRDGLEALVARIGRCRVCRDEPSGRPLPHEPRPVLQVGTVAPALLLCGQAPGTRAHASGKPFSDPSGQRLRAWLGVSEAEFYDAGRIAIVPMGFCFPGTDPRGGDRPPRPECARTWHGALLDAIGEPGLTVTLGAPALRHHLARRGSADLMAGTLDATLAAWRTLLAEARILALPHPSWRNTHWLKRNPWFDAELLPVLRAEVDRLLRAPGGPRT